MNTQELKDFSNGFWRDTECLRYIHGLLKLPASPESRNFSGRWDALYNTAIRREVHKYESHKLIGAAFGSNVSTELEAFELCTKKIKLKYPIIK
jgi:hypothetical protein